jgi:type III pantothenate kinase
VSEGISEFSALASQLSAFPPNPVRTLVLNLGNTSLFGGVFTDGRCRKTFRLPLGDHARLSRLVVGTIDAVALSSVVPRLTAQVSRLVRRIWHCTPFVLTADQPHGLEIGYRHPRELGTDRLAAALGAATLFPRRDVLVVDCGTATTVTALSRDGCILGGAILPGVSLWSEMLASRTAQLPRASASRPRSALGRSPQEAIASGIYFGHLGAIRETVQRVRAEAFGRRRALVIGTGGHADRFAREKLFNHLVPGLVLTGLDAFARRARPLDTMS